MFASKQSNDGAVPNDGDRNAMYVQLFPECFVSPMDGFRWVSPGIPELADVVVCLLYWHAGRAYSVGKVDVSSPGRGLAKLLFTLEDGRRHVQMSIEVRALSTQAALVKLFKGTRRTLAGQSAIGRDAVGWKLTQPEITFTGATSKGRPGAERVRLVIGTVNPSTKLTYKMFDYTSRYGIVHVYSPQLKLDSRGNSADSGEYGWVICA